MLFSSLTIYVPADRLGDFMFWLFSLINSRWINLPIVEYIYNVQVVCLGMFIVNWPVLGLGKICIFSVSLIRFEVLKLFAINNSRPPLAFPLIKSGSSSLFKSVIAALECMELLSFIKVLIKLNSVFKFKIVSVLLIVFSMLLYK